MPPTHRARRRHSARHQHDTAAGFWTLAETAHHLKVSLPVVRRAARKGLIPTLRVGPRTVRVSPAALAQVGLGALDNGPGARPARGSRKR